MTTMTTMTPSISQILKLIFYDPNPEDPPSPLMTDLLSSEYNFLAIEVNITIVGRQGVMELIRR